MFTNQKLNCYFIINNKYNKIRVRDRNKKCLLTSGKKKKNLLMQNQVNIYKKKKKGKNSKGNNFCYPLRYYSIANFFTNSNACFSKIVISSNNSRAASGFTLSAIH